MANRDGVITKKDVFEQEAIDAPLKYVENLEKAIQKQKELIEISKNLRDLRASMGGISNDSQYAEAQRQANLESQRAINAIREQERAEISLNRIRRETLATQQAEARAQQTAERQRRSNVQLTIEERVEQQHLNRQLRQEAMERLGLIRPYQQLANRRNEARAALRDLMAQENANTRQVRQATREYERLDRQLRRIDTSVGDFTRNVGNYGTRFASLGRSLLGAFGIFAGADLLAGAVKSVFNLTKELQGLDQALKQVSTSQEDFVEQQNFLNRISESYGVEIRSLTKSYTQFYVVAKDKLAGQEIQNIFESVTKAGARMGLSVDAQNRAFLALQQMMSKGTVQSEELRGQLGEALPGAFGIMAKSIGVTEIQLGKMLKAGTVLAADVLPKFAKQLEKTYNIETINRIENLNASSNRLSNTWTKLIRNLNETETGGLSSFFKFFVDGTNEILKNLDLISNSKAFNVKSKIQEGREEAKALFQDLLAEDPNKLSTEDFIAGKRTTGVPIADTPQNRARKIIKEAKIQLESEKRELKRLQNELKEDERSLLRPLKSMASLGVTEGMLFARQKKVLEQLKKTQIQASLILEAEDFLKGKKKPKTQEIELTDAQKKALEKAEKERLARLKRISDAEFELEKQRLEQIIKVNDEIASNEKLNDNERLKALKTRLDTEGQLVELEKNNKLKQDNFVLAKDRMLENEKLFIRNEARNKNIDNEKKAQKELDKITAFDEDYFKSELAEKITLLKEAEAQELALAKEKYRKLRRLDRLNPENIEGYEAEKLSIRNKYAIKEIQAEITTAEEILALSNAYEQLGLGGMALASKKKEEILKQLSDLKLKLLSIEEKEADAKAKKELETEKRKWAKIKEWAKEAYDIARGFIDQGFENRISKIDQEIQASDEYYQRQIELAGNDQRTKDILQAESEKKRKVLEEEKKKEQKKQFEINKALAVAEIAMNTASAIMAIARTGNGTYYADFGISAGVAIGVTAALGAAKAALVLSQKPPAYKEGRKGGIPEWAFVGDGGVNEVLEKQDGTVRISPNVPTLTYLERGENVYKSVDDYLRNSKKLNFDSVYQKEKEYNLIKNNISFEDKYQKENNEILKRILAENMKKKHTIISNKIDLGHEIWKRNQNSFL